jgi:peptidoglycan/LPS O-acetylase OafA/YrhL
MTTQYVRNRVLRIYPALWVCLLVSIGIILSAGVRPRLTALLPWVAAQASFLQFYNPAFLRAFGIGVLNGSLWTIPVELQFYAVLPGLALVARQRLSRWVGLALAGFVLMFAARATLGDGTTLPEKLLAVSILPYLFYFLVGVIARYVYERRPRTFEGRLPVWLGVYAVWAVIETRYHVGSAFGNHLNPLSIVLLAAVTVSAAFTGRTLAQRLIAGNDLSYGLYIYHAVLINVLIVGHVKGPWLFPIYISASVMAAGASWILIEKPALRLKRQTLRAVA